MRRRWLLLLLLCLPVIAGQAPPARKPILFVVHADWCPPCRHFDRVYCDRRDVRDALQDAFEVRELDWDVPVQRSEAIAMGVSSIPSYVVTRGHRRVAMSEGFTTRTDRVAIHTALTKLMTDLGVEWPRARRTVSPDPPPQVTAPDPPPRATVPEPRYIPHIDQTARDGVDKLASQTRELQATQQQTTDAVTGLQGDVADVRSKIADVQTKVEQSRESITGQLQQTQSATQDQLRSIADNLRESIEQVRESIPAATETPTPFPEAAPDISTEIPPPETPAAATGSKWLRVGTWIAGTAVKLAAPEFALPLSLGLGAAGWLVARVRQRKGSGHRPGTFPGLSDVAHVPAGPQRDNTEVEQILSLRQQEQRDPVHDALFGVLFEDEYRAKPDQPVKDAWHSAMDRFNNIAPLSTASKTVTSTASTKGP